jgi:hypothetical protein
LWDRNPAHLTKDAEEFKHDPHKNPFYRAPRYIERAANMGLGVGSTRKMDYQRLMMG